MRAVEVEQAVTDAARYQAGVRIVMREAFERLAAARGLVPPSGALVVDTEVPETLLAELRTTIAAYDGEGIEELGYAYESLLERVDRKHSGAHYTPRVLADEVVAHALAPLLDSGRGVLDLRIADIAAGSGVFLVSAARYLAATLTDLPYDEALRAVTTTCLYGADINPTSVELCRLSLWLLAGDDRLPLTFLDDRILVGDALLDVDVDGRVPVRWPDGGFDAVIGNPPFLGVKNIRGAVGARVRDRYASTLLGGGSGRSDLVVFFLARATQLSRNVVGLVVPDAISEGDSARFGPGRALENGYRIYRAETSRPWPSAAGVRIALIWLQRMEVAARGPAVLDGREVAAIGATLGRGTTTGRDEHRRPPSWMPHGYQATIVLGKSLVLSLDEAAALIAADPRITPYVRDYLSGDDLVSAAGSPASRRVLDLGSADLETLRTIPALGPRLDQLRVERDGQAGKYPQLATRWWGFLNPVDRLYDDLDGLPEAIAFSKHAKYIWPVLVPTGPIFSNGVIVYPTHDRALYAFFASTPHRLWAIDEGGSRLNLSHRYNPSRLLARYPFPESFDGARDAGEQLAAAVDGAQTELGIGITDVLNRVHGVQPVAAVVDAVRAAIGEVDRAVLAAHGISVDVEHAVQQEASGSRFGLDRVTENLIKARLVAD